MTQIADALWTNYSPSYSTKNNCSSHCSTADQEPSAHHPLSSLWRKGHCTPSRLQTYFSDGAILPWPQGVPDPTAATTLKTKTDKLKLEKEGKTSLYYYSHSISLWCGVPSMATSPLLQPWKIISYLDFCIHPSTGFPLPIHPGTTWTFWSLHTSPGLNSTPKYGLFSLSYGPLNDFFSDWGTTCLLIDNNYAGLSLNVTSFRKCLKTPTCLQWVTPTAHCTSPSHTVMYHSVHRDLSLSPTSFEL